MKFLGFVKGYRHWKGVPIRHSLCMSITLMLLVADLPHTKWPKPWHIGTDLRVLSESYLMNNNITVLRWFSKIFLFFFFGQNEPQY